MKEIQDITSVSTRKAAECYYLLARLFLRTSETPDDCQEVLEKVNKYKLVLAKMWAVVDGADGISIELTWERLRVMFQEVAEDPEYQKQVEAKQPEFEFGTQQKRNKWTVSGDHGPCAKKGQAEAWFRW